MRTYRPLFTICALAIASVVVSQNFTIDPAFWHLDDGLGYCVMEDTVADRILVGGEFERVMPPTPIPYGVELNATSGLATEGYPIADSTVRCVIPDGTGGWIIGGAFTQVGGQPRQHLAHILADGSLASWSPAVNGLVLSLALKGDTVYLGGLFSNVNSAARSNLAAVRLSTGANVTWAAGTANGIVRCMSLSTGRLFVGGDFTTVNGTSRPRGASFTLNNHALTNWTPNANGSVYCIAATSTVVYIGGAFTLVNTLMVRNRLAAFPPTSNTPTAWNPNANGTVRAIALSGTDVFFGGDFSQVSLTARNHIALVNASGVLQSWSRDLDGDVHCLTVANNVLYTGGDLTLVDGKGRQRLVAFGVPGSGLPTITDWSPATENTVMSIAAQGGALFVGGVFQRGGGLSRRNIVAFDPATGSPTAWAPQANNAVFALERAGTGAVFAGGDFSQLGGAARTGLAAIDPVSGEVLPWSVPPDTIHVTDLAVQGDTLFVCGAFRNMGGQAREHLAAVSISAAVTLPWNVALGAVDKPTDLLVENDTLYLCGALSSVGGQPRNGVGSIKVSTSTVLGLSAGFLPADWSVSQLAKAAGKLFISGVTDEFGVGTNAYVLDAVSGAVAAYSISGYQCVAAYQDRFYAGYAGPVVLDARTGIELAKKYVPDFFALDLIRARNGDLFAVGYYFGTTDKVVHLHADPGNAIRVMLDGPFVAGSMSNPLRDQALIPLTEPYTALGYVHSGGGGGEVAPANIHTVSLGGAGTEVVDWVLVEYRDPLDAANIVASFSCLLLENGTVRTSDWGQLPTFVPDPNGSYFVAVRHRNHLGVMTAQPVDFSTSPFIDFTWPATPVFGNNARKTNSGTGVLWSGDVNFDGTIKYTGANNDRDPVLVRVGGTVPTNTAAGYFSEDVNMDGLVKYTGFKNDRDPTLVNVGGIVPTNVREEQLP
ncbi:MAG: hypothetical protein IT228_00560 [Flavobacteriales bacterium]|nr:hypothetical protein [Flavobacteriales bacterium]MCC6575811.1 hypothetical protein [Flavobacteriales bacterium]NUQ13948.1 hypothetical protein [Flavobacteriales bacterium]